MFEEKMAIDKSKIIKFIYEIGTLVVIAFLIRTFGFGLYQVPTGSMETTLLTGERFFSDKFTPLFVPIKRGDIIAFNKPVYKYSKNYLVNLWQRYVWGPENWTKRVIGIPGDHVEGKIEDGHPVVYLNGKKLDEPYLNKYPLVYVFKKEKPGFQDLMVGNFSAKPVTYDSKYYRINPELILKDPQGNIILDKPDTPLPENKDVFDVNLEDNQYWVMGDNRKGSADSRYWGILDGSLIHGKIVFRIWSIDSESSWWIFDLLSHPIDFFKRIRWSRCLQTVS